MSRSKTKHRPRSAPSAPQAAPVGILVLGMHRSGTSAVTRVLNLLGADLGPRLLPAVEGVNDAGFWEHADAVALDDKLLHWHDRPWHSVQPMPVDTIGRDLLAQARADIGALIRRDFADSALWAVKDPRMSLLAPVWIRALHEAGVSPRVLVAVRHPDEVAASLRRRDAITRAHADLLWGTYFIDAVRASAGLPRAICDYAGLLADWREAATRIGEALEVRWPVKPDAAAAEVDGFLRADQRRHHAGDESLGTSDALHASVLELYAVAVAIAEGRAQWDALDAPIAQFERVRRQAAPHVQELLDHVWAHADRARALELQLARLRSPDGDLDQILALRQLLAEKDARLHAAGDSQHRADTLVAQMRAHVEALEAARNRLNEEVGPLHARLEVAQGAVLRMQQVIDEKEARLVASGAAQQRLESALAAVQAHAAALEPARDELRRQLDVAEAVLAERNDRLVTVLAGHQRLESALAELHAHAAALETARADLRRELEVAQSGIHCMQQLIDEKDARFGVMAEVQRQRESAMADLAAHAHALDAARDALRDEIEMLQRQGHDHADAAGRNAAALADWQAHAHALEAARTTLNARIEVLEGELATATALAPRLRQQLGDREARLAAVSTALAESEASQARERQALALLRNSRSWRVTAPLRAVLAWLRPGS